MPGKDKSWSGHSRNWDKFGPPLRPTTAVADHMREQMISGNRILMLGVTPELHAVFDNIIAVDRDPDMIRNVWPGDTDTKTAIQGEWLQMRWPEGSFDGIACDGGLGMLEDPDDMRYFQSLCMRWLKPGGTVVHRLFERPTGRYAITRERLLLEVDDHDRVNWHAFKWLMAFNICDVKDDSNLGLVEIMDLFNDMFPDRDALSIRTGWSRESIDTIDLYAGSDKVSYFGTREEYAATIPGSAIDVSFRVIPGYDLSEHCPIMRWRKP